MEWMFAGTVLSTAALGWTVLYWIRVLKRPDYGAIAYATLLFWNALFLLGPQLVITLRTETPTPYHTFAAGESAKTLTIAAVHTMILLGLQQYFELFRRRVPRRAPPQLSRAPSKPVKGQLVIVALASVGIIATVALFGGDAFGYQAARAIASGDIGSIYEMYDEVRYRNEKGRFLEEGIRGLGTLNYACRAAAIIAAGLAVVELTRRRQMTSYLLATFACAAGLYVCLATGARSDLCMFVLSVGWTLIGTGKRTVWRLVTVATLTYLGFIALTAISSKRAQSENLWVSLGGRLLGNAANDSHVVTLADEGVLGAYGSRAGVFARDFVPLDLELNWILSRERSNWYESATIVGVGYNQARWLGVVINAVGIVLLARGSTSLLLKSSNHETRAALAAVHLGFLFRLIFSGLGVAHHLIVMAPLFYLAGSFSSRPGHKAPPRTAKAPPERSGT